MTSLEDASTSWPAWAATSSRSCTPSRPRRRAVYADRIRCELAAAGLSASIGTATLERTGTIAGTEAAADAAMYADKRRRQVGRV